MDLTLMQIMTSAVNKSVGLLPLEIRDSKTGAVAGRTVIRSLNEQLTSLGEGDWILTVSLPSGQHLSTTVTTAADGRIDSTDLLDQLVATSGSLIGSVFPSVTNVAGASGSPSFKDIDWTSLTGNLAGMALDKVLATLGVSPSAPTSAAPVAYGQERRLRFPDARLKFFRGSPLGDGRMSRIAASAIKVEMQDGKMAISDPAMDLLIVQLLRPDLPPANLILPPCVKLLFSVQQLSATNAIAVAAGPIENLPESLTQQKAINVVAVAASFNDDFTDQAVGFRARANVSDLNTIASNLTSEEIGRLGTKPIGAAVCLLYLILNTRDKESVETALLSLPQAAESAPDVSVIKAEMAAREGAHQAALDGFLSAFAKGLPWFGRGLSLLVDRLGLYEKMFWASQSATTSESPFTPSSTDGAVITSALDRLRPFGANADYSSPVMTYSGSDPLRPSPERLARSDFQSGDGFPISLS